MLIKEAKEFKWFKEGKSLTRRQAILAQCYECNGYEAENCLGTSCPLYEYHPYRKVPKLTHQNRKKISPESIKALELWKKAKKEKINALQ